MENRKITLKLLKDFETELANDKKVKVQLRNTCAIQDALRSL